MKQPVETHQQTTIVEAAPKEVLSAETAMHNHSILRAFVNSTTQGLYPLMEATRYLTEDPAVSEAWYNVLKSLKLVNDAIFESEKKAIRAKMKDEAQ